MIREEHVSRLLTDDFPDVNVQPGSTGIFRLAQEFARYSSGIIARGDLATMKKCFGFADNMLREGSPLVRIAFQNVYLFSVATFIDMLPSGQQFRELMTPGVKQYYCRYLTACGA